MYAGICRFADGQFLYVQGKTYSLVSHFFSKDLTSSLQHNCLCHFSCNVPLGLEKPSESALFNDRALFSGFGLMVKGKTKCTSFEPLNMHSGEIDMSSLRAENPNQANAMPKSARFGPNSQMI